MRRGAAVKILLVEDNPADARITVEAFRDANCWAEIQTVDNGADALNLLRQNPPDLVLLDLNLPRLSGHDVLVEMRRDPNLSWVPVIVVSSSDNPADVQRAYNAHASLFLKKPLDLERYFSMVRTIKELWLDFAVLPQAGNGSGP